MTVAELIEFLKTQPQDLPVAFDLHSEHILMVAGDIRLMNACEARQDGWVPRARPDKPSRAYLMFPGN